MDETDARLRWGLHGEERPIHALSTTQALNFNSVRRGDTRYVSSGDKVSMPSGRP